ncbi:MAG: Flp pilus assembly complex ATPase component TadA [Planctomycetes bacterium]|nr:Flp pilus assembly complex ATPase component TadA [Planctomycetota bacterium]
MLKILFPTDYSICSNEALRYAVTLAAESSGSLVILHVVEPMSPYLVPESAPPGSTHRDEFFATLQTLLAEKPVAYEERTIIGTPVATITHVAETEHVDLIVMGTVGRTGVKRMLLGSVAEEVVRRAPCPVLTLKAPTEDESRRRTRAATIRTWPEDDIELGTGVPTNLPAENPDNPALSLILRGIRARASDIHLDPAGADVLVRFRVDGRMRDYCKMDHAIGHGVVTQLKLMANLDIADPFHPKEGRLQMPDQLRGIDVRITSVPAVSGEAISLRLHNRDRLVRPLQELGLSADSLSTMERMLKHGEGIVLVTGPTGAGKTTTMYSMLRALDDGSRNIVSIEDPIEFVIPSFRQVAVDPRHGITMTSGLRTLLRLDPDVVFVSEIRDAEAADTAMRAASSGKYVFTSLHTRDVASTITALRDLHIDNRSLGGNLTGIISQRLVRRLCRECCRPDSPTSAEATLFANQGIVCPQEILRPVGCPRCHNSGYYDRVGVFEVVIPTLETIRAIEEGMPEDEVRRILRSQGTPSLEGDALEKVAQGMTSLEEFSAMTSIKMS